MADNVTVDNGTLTDYTVSSDEAASGQVQRVKVAYSADGADTHVPADADGLLVNLGANNDVTVTGTVTAQDGGGSLTVDGTVTADTELTTADLDTGAGTDTRAVVGLVGSKSGGGALIPGDATAGLKVDLGADNDVVISDGGNVISVDDAAGSLTVDNAALSVTGGGVEATALRVTLASDSTGVVSVDDNGGSLTVDGSVTANAGTNLNTSALALESGGNLATIAGAVKAEDAASADGHTGIPALAVRKGTPANTSGTDGDYEQLQMSAGRLWTSATVDAALPAGTNAIGKLAANSGVDIGDVDVTSVIPGTGATNLGKAEDAAHSSGDTGVYALAVRDDDPAVHSGTDGDYESLHVSASGGLWSSEVATAAGGCEAFFTYDADETEEDVKTSAGSVYGWYIYNDGAAEVYVRLYNATAANTTVGSTAARIVLPIPAGSAANMAFTPGIKFDTAICIAATTGVGAADTTAPAANQVVATIFYK